MLLGALVDLGLEAAFVEGLPAALGLEGVGVRVARVLRCGVSAVKVDFDIPPQPHGRHLKQIIAVVDAAPISARVKELATGAFRDIATVEAEIHGSTVDRVHLHEVGAVDAILDVLGNLRGLEQLGVTKVHCGPIALGDGSVETAHGRMPVPAPATMRLLAGLTVSPGPPQSGELATPTGAALVRALGAGPWPTSFVPRKVGYGAGTREFPDRPNVLRVILADAAVDGAREEVLVLVADIDDSPPEFLAAAAELLRAAGALDVTLSPVTMKKGRLGSRLEVLARPADADALERAVLVHTSTIGVRRLAATRRVLPREEIAVTVLGHVIRVKRVTFEDGNARVKPSLDDLNVAALATGRSIADISALATEAARHVSRRV